MSLEISNTKIREFCPPKNGNMKEKQLIGMKSDIVQPVTISYWNGLYLIVILAISILMTSILTLIPRQNSVLYPIYWYEIALMYIFVLPANAAFTHILELFIYLNITELASIKLGLKYFLGTSLVMGIPYLGGYLIWTIILGNNHPLPFLALITYFTSWILFFPLIWISIPSELRAKKDMRMKIRSYFLYQSMWIFIQLQLTALGQIFQMLSAGLWPQWIMALLIPSCRAFNTKLLEKLVYRMAGPDNQTADVLLAAAVDMYFGLFVAILLASASELTVYCILGVDFLLHLRSCFGVVKLHKKIQNSQVGEADEMKQNMDKAVENLLLSEIIEGLIPLSYAASFATAYYGPNATMIGNVRSNYFDFKEVDNIDYLFLTMVQMFAVDIVGMLVTAIVLWFYGKRNLLYEVCKVMKKYWIILAIKLAGGFYSTFAQNDVNVGMDTTFKFEWITEEGRIRFIQNATDISVLEKLFLLGNDSRV